MAMPSMAMLNSKKATVQKQSVTFRFESILLMIKYRRLDRCDIIWSFEILLCELFYIIGCEV